MKSFLSLLLISCSIGLFGINNTREIQLTFKSGCQELPNHIKDTVLQEYLNTGNGDWVYFNTINKEEIAKDRLAAYKSAKFRNRLIGNFLYENGLKKNQILYKYASYEFVWINKPKENKKFGQLSDAVFKNEQTITFKNIDGIQYKTPNGNTITFKGMSFDAFSDDKITLKITEFVSKRDFIEFGVTALSNTGMLESQGMYHIAAFQNDAPVQLRRNVQYELNISNADTTSGYYAYYGKKQAGSLTWSSNETEEFTISESTTRTSVDTVVVDNEYGELEFYSFLSEYSTPMFSAKFGKLGWINCDRFYDTEDKVTQLISINNGKSKNPYAVFIIFHNINSVLPIYKITNGIYETPEIPNGEKVTVVAMRKEKDDKTNIAYSDFTTTNGKKIDIAATQLSASKLDLLLADLIP